MNSKELEVMLSPRKADFIKMMQNRPEKFTQEISFALQAINGNELLKQCDKNTIGAAVWNVALTGLSLNPILKLAYLTPRWNSRKQANECVLVPSYQGLVKTITDSGSAVKVEAFIIMEGDRFEQEFTTDGTRIVHVPAFPKGKTIIGAWAMATLKDGSKQVEVMDKAELDYIRSKSDSWKSFEAGKAKSSIWNDWESEMCRKTVIKRLVKYLPKSEQFEKVSQVIEVDNHDYTASHYAIDKASQLLDTSTYDHDTRAIIAGKLESGELSQAEVSNIIGDLEINQLDRIDSGMPYSATDIKKKLAAIPA